jgi:hypothetical protein
MFKEITLTSKNNIPNILGQLAESLLFYEKVNLVCSPYFFKKLIDLKELDSFIELMSSQKINILIEKDLLSLQNSSVKSNNVVIPNLTWQRVCLVKSKDKTVYERLERVINNETKNSSYSRKVVTKIADNSSTFIFDSNLLQFINQDIQDKVYLKRAISQAVNIFNSAIVIPPETIEVLIHEKNNGFILETNLNLDQINQSKSSSKFTVNSMIQYLIHVREDTMLASKFNSDLATNPLTTRLIEEKFNHIIKKTTANTHQINGFSELVFTEGRSISNVINNGEKSLSEFLKILEKADQFKTWLKGVDQDKKLIAEYYKAVSKETWVDKMPAKSFRWVFFTATGLLIDILGAGGIGTLSGLGVSAGDTFLLDKLLKGWTPDTFINEEASKFVAPKANP